MRASLSDTRSGELTELLKSYNTIRTSTHVFTRIRAIRAIEIQQYYKDHPEKAISSDKTSVKPLESLIIGIDISREERRERISRRLDDRLEEGMIGEIEKLIRSGVSPSDLIYYGLEYKFVTLHVIGQLSLSEMKRQLEIAIHQFAKRQMTWFRGMERRGFKIRWLPYDMPDDEFIEIVGKWKDEF